jgi:CO/xanthine dehydrogenase Mo-binding subunit
MQPFLSDKAVQAAGAVNYGYVLRAPIARGRLRGLRSPSLPDGYLLLRARDIPGKKTLSCVGFAHPVLGDPQVRYRGQPFALLCGPDREALAELAAAVRADWEEAPGEEAGAGKVEARSAAAPLYRRGNPAEVFADAFQIVEAEYVTGRRWSHDPDLPGAYVEATEKGVTVYASTQDPFGLRETVAAVLKLPSRRVRVVATRLGNPMESKFLQSALVAAHASLLSAAARKPVWLGMDAAESCQYAFPGPGFRVRTRTALDREGNMVGVRQEIEVDAGAYAPAPASALLPAARCSWGGYRVSNVEITGTFLRSNKVPSGPFRAAGRAQAFFAVELNSSRLEEIGELDPYSWKSRNLARVERAAAGRSEGEREGGEAAPAAPRSVLDAAVSMSNFRRKHAAFASLKKRRTTALDSPFPLRGAGLAVAYQEKDDPGIHIARPHASTVRAVLDKDKRLHLYTSFVDHGPGVHALFARRAAKLLELEPDRVVVEEVDTQVVPDSGPTTLGRALAVGLPLVEQCCQAVKIKRIKGLPPIEARRSHKAPDPSARADGPRPSLLADAAWAAAVVEVEVDPVGLQILVRGVWLALACGACDDLLGAERYLVGEAVRALGWASLAESGVPDGGIRPPEEPAAGARPPQADPRAGDCPRWGAGSLPRLDRVPLVRVRFVDDPNPVLRGFEQLPHLTVPGAYAAAVSQATGLYVDRVPITPEVLQECLET